MGNYTVGSQIISCWLWLEKIFPPYNGSIHKNSLILETVPIYIAIFTITILLLSQITALWMVCIGNVKGKLKFHGLGNQRGSSGMAIAVWLLFHVPGHSKGATLLLSFWWKQRKSPDISQKWCEEVVLISLSAYRSIVPIFLSLTFTPYFQVLMREIQARNKKEFPDNKNS